MKRFITVCAVLLAMSTALFAPARAAEESPVCYPTAIIVSEDGTELRKIYDLSPEADPAGIPRSDFEQGGFHYTFTDILRQELPEYEERVHTETVSFDSPKKDMESVLALLPQEREAVTEDGFLGTLSLKLDSVRVEVSGYGSTTKELSATRTYPNLDGQDTACIPKSIEDNGKTLTLQSIDWQISNAANVDGYAVGERYTAVATVSRIHLNRVRYIAIFEGVSLVPAEPEPTEAPAPTEEPAEEWTVRESETHLPTGEAEPAPMSFPWKILLIPMGLIAVSGVGIAVALTLKRRAEASENLSSKEDEDE